MWPACICLIPVAANRICRSSSAHSKGRAYEVVTFATWEEGFLVRPGNPKSIRTAADLDRSVR